jgi:protein KTI12
MCEEWNKSRPTPYPDQIFQELLLRFEEPNPSQRWDSPLFTAIYDDAELPIEEIWACLTNTKTKPNQSTIQRFATEPDSLYELEKGTQDIVATIIQRVQDGGGGGSIRIAGVDKVLEVPVDGVSLGQLQRLRRTFVQYQRNHPAEKGRIKELFVDYLNGQFE